MPNIRHVLFATDLSRDDQASAEFVAALAHPLNAQVHVLHIATGAIRTGTDGFEIPENLRSQLDRLVLAASLNRVDTRAVVRSGRPAEEIVTYAAANDIGLIAMGSRGRTHLAQALLGSVAEQVVRTASCPVLILPPDALKPHPSRLAQAARALARKFGPGVVGARDVARAQLVETLQNNEGLGAVEANGIVQNLESSGALIWHTGSADDGPNSHFWAINPDAIAADSGPSSVDTPGNESVETSAATDLLRHAIGNRATDIHIDPASEEEFEVRLRIDGRLEHYCRLDRRIAAPLIQQYKVLAHLDIADPFKPQEGRLNLPSGLDDCEVRITTAPVHFGQAMALRLFHSERLFQPLESLGLSAGALDAVERILRARSGLVLVTGPTGSGKTTTIYSLLHQLSATSPNIISIEDPVEYRLPFMRQLSVDPRHAVSMTSGLRTILRMDPDVVFLGEIRDVEAADIAMRAASAGRFVFSTLHTRDIASTVTALRDLHVDSRSLGANLTGIISQRLVRRLCTNCCRPEPATVAEQEIFVNAGIAAPETLSRPVGCTHCRNTGYRDRLGIFEAVATAGPAVDAIVAGVPESEFSRVLQSAGAQSLRADGLHKAAAGLTTLEEVQGMQSVRSSGPLH